jgi:Fungal specific transcription factor domain
VYFERIYPGAPFIHKDRLLASFESDNQPNPALLYILYAMAVCQKDQVPEDIVSTYSPTFFQNKALFHVQKNLAELKDLFQTVQALAFLTVYETGLSRRANSMHAYLLCGQALRLSVMLGLHLLDETYDQGLREPVRHAFPTLLPPPTSYDELEGSPANIWLTRTTADLLDGSPLCAIYQRPNTVAPVCADTAGNFYLSTFK